MRKLVSLALIGSSLVIAGCAKNASDPDSASAALDSSDSVESEGNVMMAVTDGADMAVTGAPLTADQVAVRIAANVALRWTPSSCATVTSSGADVTIKFDDCTGPRGLLHVTGELDLVVSVSAAGAISVQGTASGLEVNNAVLDINLTATYSVSGTEHQLAVQTMGSGTGALGNTIDHSGNYTVSWDTGSQCGSIAGMWSTEISSSSASATRSNDVNVMRCAGGCPTGTIVHTGFRGVTLTVTFDGTNVAQWSTSTGKSGTVNLACQ